MKENRVKQLSSEELLNIVKVSNSYTEILRKLGYERAGRCWTELKKRIKDEGIDISHFKNWAQINQLSLDDILIKNSTYNNQTLKERIVKEQLIEYKCYECGNEGEWNGKPLTLQLHHKDGDSRNNTLENLGFLCPNCHSQTPTFSGKKNKKK